MLKYNCVNSKNLNMHSFFLCMERNKKLKKINLTDFQKRKFSYMCMILFFLLFSIENTLETNKIKTIYGKKDIKDFVDRTIQDDINNIIYLIKDKSKRRLITTTGLQLSN